MDSERETKLTNTVVYKQFLLKLRVLRKRSKKSQFSINVSFSAMIITVQVRENN